MKNHTILFDLDGTLINTNELITASFKHTFEKFDLHFTEEEIIEFNGPPLVDTFQKIDPERVDAMVETYREHNHRVHDDYVEIFPHVFETLEALQEMNIKMGVVTTKVAQGAKRGLALTGITDFFDSIVTLTDVTHAKPHPEPVLKAMRELGAKKEDTIMVGDSFYDIEAGHNAGIKTAGVSWSQKGKERLLSYRPTYMLERMTDLLPIVGAS